MNKTLNLYFSHHPFCAQKPHPSTLQILPLWEHDPTGKIPSITIYLSTHEVNPCYAPDIYNP